METDLVSKTLCSVQNTRCWTKNPRGSDGFDYWYNIRKLINFFIILNHIA